MRTEFVVGLKMCALTEKIKIKVGKDRRKPIGILQVYDGVLPAYLERVAIDVRRDFPAEEISVGDAT